MVNLKFKGETMRKLLVLGSDYYTKDIVEEARRRGIYVVVADYNK